MALDATAAGLAGLVFGVAAGTAGLSSEVGIPFPTLLIALGALLLLAGALIRFRGAAPPARPSLGVILLLLGAGLALAATVSAPWWDAQTAHYKLHWPAELLLWAVAAAAVASALLDLTRRSSPHLLATTLPAGGAAAFAVPMVVSDWADVNDQTQLGYGIGLAAVAGALIALVGAARLVRDR